MREGDMRKPFTALISLLAASLLLAPLSYGARFSPSFASLAGPKAPRARSGLLEEVLTRQPASNAGSGSGSICRPTGQIEDACCDYETVEDINGPFFDQLRELVQTQYFRYYKVDLFKDCPFWVENGLCMNRACGVETADESEIPPEYRAQQLSSVEAASSQEVFSGSQPASLSCGCHDTDFCHLDDDNAQSAVYVDLVKNPERFTGYAGASANRVWKSIYEENCFGAVQFIEPARDTSSGGTGFVGRDALRAGLSGSSPVSAVGGFGGLVGSLQAPPDAADEEMCLEKRVFYRIISGLHASISVHICHDYLDQKTGEWAPNLECFVSRIAEHPERLQNVYFNYVLLLRALARAGDYVDHFALRPGDEIADVQTREKFNELVHVARDCPPTFDEHSMFVGPDAAILKEEFKAHFRNVSTIMDCVGCDKCRLWGKLQVNGLGTALKILFSFDDADFDPAKHPAMLQRSELVALINTAHRFAESLHAVETFREMYQATLEKPGAKSSGASSQITRSQSSNVLTERESQAAAPEAEAETTPPSRSSSSSSSSSAVDFESSPPPSAVRSQRQRFDDAPSLRETIDRNESSESKDIGTRADARMGATLFLPEWLANVLEKALRTCTTSLDACFRWARSVAGNGAGARGPVDEL